MTFSVFDVFALSDLILSFRLQENEQRAKVLQQEREYYSSQARTLQQSLSQLTVDKQQTEAELKVTQHDSAALSLQLHSNTTLLKVSLKANTFISCQGCVFKN